jgi:hypothetical protein
MTGQYPKRRETDAEAQRRNEVAELKRQARLDEAMPMTEAAFRAFLPRLSQSGRVVKGLR